MESHRTFQEEPFEMTVYNGESSWSEDFRNPEEPTWTYTVGEDRFMLLLLSKENHGAGMAVLSRNNDVLCRWIVGSLGWKRNAYIYLSPAPMDALVSPAEVEIVAGDGSFGQPDTVYLDTDKNPRIATLVPFVTGTLFESFQTFEDDIPSDAR